MPERRVSPRVSGPLNATWSGASGGPCRVPNLSATGCYVNSLATPPVGSSLTMTFVTHQDRALHLSGEVRSVDPGIGFSVEFTDMPTDDFLALVAWIAALAAAGPMDTGPWPLALAQPRSTSGTVRCSVCTQDKPATGMRWVSRFGRPSGDGTGALSVSLFETTRDDPQGIPYCQECLEALLP
jgi:hypothetical protein